MTDALNTVNKWLKYVKQSTQSGQCTYWSPFAFIRRINSYMFGTNRMEWHIINTRLIIRLTLDNTISLVFKRFVTLKGVWTEGRCSKLLDTVVKWFGLEVELGHDYQISAKNTETHSLQVSNMWWPESVNNPINS